MPNYKKTTKYEADNGAIHPITMGLDLFTAIDNPPSGAQTSDIRVKISKNRRQYGLRPRGVDAVFVKSSGTGDQLIRQTFRKFFPLLSKASAASTTFSVGNDITYKGNVYTIVTRVAEDF